MKKLMLWSFLCLLGVCQNPAWSESQEIWIKKIEAYMNTSKTWQASFEQLNPNGKLYEGSLYLQRPGKMRLIYNYPKNQTLIADGKWLIIHDPENEELTTLSLKDSPADFFLREKISFDQDSTITYFEEDQDKITLTLIRHNEPDLGNLTLTFAKNPFRLLQWIIIDANQLKTIMNLQHIEFNKQFDPKIFVFNHLD